MHQQNKHRLKLRDEEDDQAIATYAANSSVDVADPDNKPQADDSSSIFSSGGAISQALAENDESLQEKSDAAKPKPPTEAEIKKQKEEKEKQKKLAEQKKKEEKEKKEKEEQKKKEEEKKKKEAQEKKEKEEKDQLARQEHLLQNFMDDDTQTQKENQSDYFYIKNPKKSLSALADTNIIEQTEGQTTSDIISKSRKSLFAGMDGGLF